MCITRGVEGPHIGNKKQRRDLANQFKDAKNPFKIVIVGDMWLTGFDAPCLHTMYADKPMQGHGLTGLQQSTDTAWIQPRWGCGSIFSQSQGRRSRANPGLSDGTPLALRLRGHEQGNDDAEWV
ncbi:MAG: hypothetical protein K8R23_15575 [Chthoniobacter sp.]|nr:hypothetical protein [Chthoniobacter sp.]